MQTNFFYRMTIWISSIRASSKKYDLQKIFNNVIIFIVILAPRLQLYNKRFRHENSTRIYCLTIELVTIKIPWVIQFVCMHVFFFLWMKEKTMESFKQIVYVFFLRF